jgi:hypothetical protein
MISNLPLDILIGFILLISMWFFYETTVLFFGHFNYWWMMLILVPIGLFVSLASKISVGLSSESSQVAKPVFLNSMQVDESRNIFRKVQISNAIDLLNIILGIMAWSVPMIIDLLFASLAILVASSLNPHLKIDDVYAICLTPLFCLIPLCYFPQLQNVFSKDARYSVGFFGIIINTLVIEFGGYASAKALSIL